jgi:hypothetical protein
MTNKSDKSGERKCFFAFCFSAFLDSPGRGRLMRKNAIHSILARKTAIRNS